MVEKDLLLNAFDCYQKIQYEHDLSFHSDILALGAVGRMKHICIHFSKYFPTFVIFPSANHPENKKDFIDSFIMTVSACNLLGIRISKHIKEGHCIENDFIINFAKISRNIAKACDSSDHQEDYPVRAEWEDNIISLACLIYAESVDRKIDIIKESIERLKSVELKDNLYFLRNHKI